MKTKKLNEDIDRAVRGVCDIRPECTKCNFVFEFLSIRKEHLTWKINGFSGLATLFEQLDKP